MARQMKDSGIEWIGEIPESWKRDKVVRVFSLIGSGTTPKSTDEEQYGGAINWIQSGDINGSIMSECKNTITEQTLEAYSALKVYHAPFIILAMYGASVGNLSISTIDGCVNQACCVLGDSTCNFQYAFYTLKAAKDYLLQKAVGGGQPNISQDIIRSLWMPKPELAEQHRIAAFLDRKCAEIDAVIERTKATIEEYKKLKQAVITEAVTKGVRGARKMKDSGIEWIGEIPEEWEVRKLKYVATILRGGSPRPIDAYLTDSPDGHNWIKIGDTTKGYKYIDGTKQKITPDGATKSRMVHKGDLLLTNSMSFGEPYILNVDGCIHDGWVAFSDYRGVDIEYLYYFLSSAFCLLQFQKQVDGGVVQNLNIDKIGSTIMMLPLVDEQREIVAYLDEKCAALDTLIAKKTALLIELETYKKSLIYEYVTGKKEVV